MIIISRRRGQAVVLDAGGLAHTLDDVCQATYALEEQWLTAAGYPLIQAALARAIATRYVMMHILDPATGPRWEISDAYSNRN